MGQRGYDGAKKVKGRKRHLLVDTQGLVLTVTVHPADVMDRDGVALLWSPEHIRAAFPRLTHVWLDAAYNGKDKGKDVDRGALRLDNSGREAAPAPGPGGRRMLNPSPRPAFTVLPRRWVVERTFAWLGQNRRLSKDYERLCETSEAMVYAAMSRLMLRQLAGARTFSDSF